MEVNFTSLAAINWDSILSEVAALLIIALAGGLTLWLKQAYKRLKSIDEAAQSLPALSKLLKQHELRIIRLERHNFPLETFHDYEDVE
jgi:hypothetical protein